MMELALCFPQVVPPPPPPPHVTDVVVEDLPLDEKEEAEPRFTTITSPPAEVWRVQPVHSYEKDPQGRRPLKILRRHRGGDHNNSQDAAAEEEARHHHHHHHQVVVPRRRASFPSPPRTDPRGGPAAASNVSTLDWRNRRLRAGNLRNDEKAEEEDDLETALIITAPVLDQPHLLSITLMPIPPDAEASRHCTTNRPDPDTLYVDWSACSFLSSPDQPPGRDRTFQDERAVLVQAQALANDDQDDDDDDDQQEDAEDADAANNTIQQQEGILRTFTLILVSSQGAIMSLQFQVQHRPLNDDYNNHHNNNHNTTTSSSHHQHSSISKKWFLKPRISSHRHVLVHVMADLVSDTMKSVMPALPTLTSSRVLISSSRHLLLALCPFLVAVQLPNCSTTDRPSLQVWSKTQCLEEMEIRRRRQQGLSGMMKNMADWVWGDTTAPHTLSSSSSSSSHPDVLLLVDMSPTVALCQADQDARLVFSWHNDGLLRQWTWTPGRLPERVRDWPAPSSGPAAWPPPSTWMDTPTHCGGPYHPAGAVLTARLYDQDQRWAVALYLRTKPISSSSSSTTTMRSPATTPHRSPPLWLANDSESSSYAPDAEQVDHSPSSSSTTCHLIVMDGPCPNDEDDDISSKEPQEGNLQAMSLLVPTRANFLVGMAFDPHQARCSLVAMFGGRAAASHTTGRGAAGSQAVGGTFLVTYPPSMLTMVQRQPQSVALVPLMLDRWAMRERNRIQHLSFYRALMEKMFDPQNRGSPEDPVRARDHLLHQIDARFLKFLFRPAFPRGTGTMGPPSAWKIRRALDHWVPRRPQEHGHSGHVNDLALEVILALHHWRGQDTEEVPADQREATEGDILEQAQAHEQRWRQLLLEIWEQEQVDRLPRTFVISNTTHALYQQVLVRGGVISCIMASTASATLQPTSQVRSAMAFLDGIATKIVDSMESKREQAAELARVEQMVWELISKADMGVEGVEKVDAVKNELKLFASECFFSVLTPDDSRKVIDVFVQLDCNDLEVPLRSADLAALVPELGFASIGQGGTFEAVRTAVSSASCRTAAASYALQCLESIRRLFMGRFLALAAIGENGPAVTTALRNYLHVTAVLWVSSQSVALPRSFFADAVGVESIVSYVAPRKRWNIAHEARLSPQDEMTLMDALLIRLSRAQPRQPSFPNMTTQLGLAAIEASLRCLHFEVNLQNQIDIPELEVLPFRSGEIAQYSHLAIRILSTFVAFPGSFEPPILLSVREEALAKCLLLSENSFTGDDDKVFSRILELLKFDPSNLQLSLNRVRLLCENIGRWGKDFSNRIIAYVSQAIQNTASLSTEGSDLLETMRSLLFHAAIETCEWGAAIDVCFNFPVMGRRANYLRRVVRRMVDAGHLASLVTTCVDYKRNTSIYSFSEPFQRILDLYSLAAETLAESSLGNPLTIATVDIDQRTDYSAALFVLHLAMGQWKKAAQALEVRFLCAKDALRAGVDFISNEPSTQTERHFMAYLAQSAFGCYYALDLSEDVESRFIISGEDCNDSAIPWTVLESDSLLSNRNRGMLGEIKENDGRLSRYKSERVIVARAIKSIGVRTLMNNGVLSDGDRVTQTLTSYLEDDDVGVELIDLLFRGGHFYEGLLVGNSLGKSEGGKPQGRDLLHDILVGLIGNHLMPLLSSRQSEDFAPSFGQLPLAIDSLTPPSVLFPPTILAPRGSISSIAGQAVRTATMYLMEIITRKYASAMRPLPMDVAELLLSSNLRVPCWLEELLAKGSGPNVWAPGLFARRCKGMSYSGDPGSLLTLYTKKGMYTEACRLVSRVLGHPFDSELAAKAPFRLPERGDVDYLPHHKIDLLWRLADQATRTAHVPTHLLRDLRLAMNEMERALEAYFTRLKLSADGYASARVLADE